ncbi:hypothetical protein F4827_006834 [Paraburkholderia bannensis]|uniref:OmpA-like domain-containing protein n=1 Tax=Paraburkholderia bannensis TaxID=765414 RepID=A0A7W9U6P7_9BURK|nr:MULTISPECIES: hypothetical protein [Paraburkholderia]MBB3261960.1 hypothetical protein [Paraburkholderia sp. WP4_3_2]MBB6106955.1 hypothetical protein [Paraburkholderia bannensis]
MKKLFLSLKLIAFVFVGLSICASAIACTINETLETRLPFNSTSLTNDDRLAIANIVLEAKKWPDVDIQAVVIAGAYVGEKNAGKLKRERGAVVSAYLVQLGIKPQNVLIEPKTLTDQMVKNEDGSLNLHQIAIELVPLCHGSCERLCSDPRVTPTSRAIR